MNQILTNDEGHFDEDKGGNDGVYDASCEEDGGSEDGDVYHNQSDYEERGDEDYGQKDGSETDSSKKVVIESEYEEEKALSSLKGI